jgi:hypothetical protein
LKRKTFILEKFLDTAFQPPIRFFPESSDGFLNLRWNYSPLKERPSVAGRPFVVILHTAEELCLTQRDSAPDAPGSSRKPASPGMAEC